jgi:hypothetical protein
MELLKAIQYSKGRDQTRCNLIPSNLLFNQTTASTGSDNGKLAEASCWTADRLATIATLSDRSHTSWVELSHGAGDRLCKSMFPVPVGVKALIILMQQHSLPHTLSHSPSPRGFTVSEVSDSRDRRLTER